MTTDVSATQDKPWRESTRTPLKRFERANGTVSRRLSFHVLAAISMASVVAAVYWWYMWVVTVGACLDAYILPQGANSGSAQQHSLLSILKNPGAWRQSSWRDYFIALDITSIAALTLALFFTRLAWSGFRNTGWRRWRDGPDFYAHAYRTGLFSGAFVQLCIQLGLLGTLLSFLLAAVAQIGVAVSKNDTNVANVAPREPTLAKDVKAIVQESARPAGDRADAVPSGQSRASSSGSATNNKELSSDIFLLLCASLVSAFIAAFLAYIIIPPLNLLNDSAVGLSQLAPIDEQSAVDEFFRQLDRTSQRLGDLDEATAALTDASQGVGKFRVATSDASQALVEMMAVLKKSAEVAETSNRRTDVLAKHLVKFQEQSERLFDELRRIVAKELKDPLEWLRQAAMSARRSSVEGGRAFEELQKMARSLGSPLKSATETSQKMFHTVVELRNSFNAVAQRENEQSSQMAMMAETFQGLQLAIEELLRLLTSNVDAVEFVVPVGIGPPPQINGTALKAKPAKQPLKAVAGPRPPTRPSLARWCRLAYRWIIGAPPDGRPRRK